MRWTPEHLTKITHEIESRLDKKRYLHTLGVVQHAVVLARLHDCNVWRAIQAALLHDCAKNCAAREILEAYTSQFGPHPYVTAGIPALTHAVAGAWLAHSEFGVSDEEVLDAIAWHPTGRANPSPTLMVLLAADYCEPSRDFLGIEEMRDLARQDLRSGVKEILRRKAEYVQRKGDLVHPATVEAYQSL